MTEIHLLSKNERELFFRTAAEIMKIPFEIIEKDYWVVWILERLFSLEKIKSYLTFKGGTSLSKIYGVIDLSIEKALLGYGTPNNPENAPSKKKHLAKPPYLNVLQITKAFTLHQVGQATAQLEREP
jgi:hypothetical protein